MKPANVLIIAATLLMFGCAAKKPVRPIHGQAMAHYDLTHCKVFSPIPGALKCQDVIFVPLTVDAKQR